MFEAHNKTFFFFFSFSLLPHHKPIDGHRHFTWPSSYSCSTGNRSHYKFQNKAIKLSDPWCWSLQSYPNEPHTIFHLSSQVRLEVRLKEKNQQLHRDHHSELTLSTTITHTHTHNI